MTEQRPAAFFVADATGLDFLNTIATPVDEPVEWITSGKDLLNWLGVAGLVPDDVREEFLKSAVPGELDAVAAQSRALREWFRTFVQRHKGKPLHADALEGLAPLNRILARDEQFGQIVARKGDPDEEAPSGVVWQMQRQWRSPDSLLLPIARSMAELVCTDDFAHVKACEGHACTLMFIDRTRGRARRWCSMALCGNRAKAQAHRDRAKVAARTRPRSRGRA
ncbi:ABATE domain-containing protein [Bradyrhizobium sp. CCGUVB1N3]|uniref:CGNR zinc finger domain-containing protein n=1 Tax=Bradyrhizobium sp. CCGUVB1N3 TaxID=2949629 RepID=UPI0020B346E6|nr:ABATE domain-containing protein [Bradyrhizobium sp. CCGUVB1N3]MCP3471643.1 ABATE domain-containing protein [Bradyrhizobium sp. CCGUVB1N3]